MLWSVPRGFGLQNKPKLVGEHFVVKCPIPPFGGEITHAGGLWVPPDYRRCYRLAVLMPRFARAIALRMRPFDHDPGMIRDDPRDRSDVADRKTQFMGKLEVLAKPRDVRG